MSEWLYALYALMYVVVGAWGVMLWLQTRRVGILILLAVMFGVFYDNFILAIGNIFGAGDLLYALSVPRFALHQFILPWVIVVAVIQARGAGITWAQSKRALQLAIAASFILMLIGVFTRVLPLELKPEVMDGVTRYVAARSYGPPVVSILSLAFVGVIGFFLWRKTGWVWVLVTSILVFIGEMIPDEGMRRMLGSGVEVLWVIAMLATERWLAMRTAKNVDIATAKKVVS
jgi:hypothetical protein